MGIIRYQGLGFMGTPSVQRPVYKFDINVISDQK
jgi:hypothetical protein